MGSTDYALWTYKEVIVYDNFARGKQSNMKGSLKDPRCRLYPNGGHIRDVDLLNHGMQGRSIRVLKYGAGSGFKGSSTAQWSVREGASRRRTYLTPPGARGQAFVRPGIEDVVFVTLRFPSGRVAHIHVSWLDPHEERRLTVVGSQPVAVFSDMEPRE